MAAGRNQALLVIDENGLDRRGAEIDAEIHWPLMLHERTLYVRLDDRLASENDASFKSDVPRISQQRKPGE
jgi:hypothetical protein